jgi:hypothetical protein
MSGSNHIERGSGNRLPSPSPTSTFSPITPSNCWLLLNGLPELNDLVGHAEAEQETCAGAGNPERRRNLLTTRHKSTLVARPNLKGSLFWRSSLELSLN